MWAKEDYLDDLKIVTTPRSKPARKNTGPVSQCKLKFGSSYMATPDPPSVMGYTSCLGHVCAQKSFQWVEYSFFKRRHGPLLVCCLTSRPMSVCRTVIKKKPHHGYPRSLETGLGCALAHETMSRYTCLIHSHKATKYRDYLSLRFSSHDDENNNASSRPNTNADSPFMILLHRCSCGLFRFATFSRRDVQKTKRACHVTKRNKLD